MLHLKNLCVLHQWRRLRRNEGVQGWLVKLQPEDGRWGKLGLLTKLESWGNGNKPANILTMGINTVLAGLGSLNRFYHLKATYNIPVFSTSIIWRQKWEIVHFKISLYNNHPMYLQNILVINMKYMFTRHVLQLKVYFIEL